MLLGCRRTREGVRIEVWDTGIGIPAGELQSVFAEHHQIGNEARERNRGLGLGLSIVQRLGGLLDHRVSVRSRHGAGSVFTIETARVPERLPVEQPPPKDATDGTVRSPGRTGTILVIEDDPDLRDLLRQSLLDEGHRVSAALHGQAALDWGRARRSRPTSCWQTTTCRAA